MPSAVGVEQMTEEPLVRAEFPYGRNIVQGLEEKRLEHRRPARRRTPDAFPPRVVELLGPETDSQTVETVSKPGSKPEIRHAAAMRQPA